MDECVEISKWVNDQIIDVGRKYARLFEEDNLKFTNAMLFLSGSRKFVKWIYRLLVNRKLLMPLEDLPQEQKESMWEFVKDICKGGDRIKEKMHEMAIVFYVIEYFLNEQK